MTTLPTTLIGEFIDASVRDQDKAAELLAAHPDLINARWLHGETVLHFLTVEGFGDGVRFLAEPCTSNGFPEASDALERRTRMEPAREPVACAGRPRVCRNSLLACRLCTSGCPSPMLFRTTGLNVIDFRNVGTGR